MSKIAAAIIAYQSEDKLPKLLKSLEGHVDYVVLGIDRKTTDKTKAVAEAWAKKQKKIQLITHEFLLEDSEDAPDGPKNFDRARNENWALIPKDCEWGFWIDTDDVLHADANLHTIADDQAPDVSQVWLLYSYFRNEHGNVTTMFWRERLIRLKVKGKWIRRLHEICVSASGRHTQDKRAWVEHENRTDESSKGDRNFTTLRAILKDNPTDEWAILYLALQHFGALQYQEAADNFLKFITLNQNMGERWQAFLYAAKSFRLNKQYSRAQETALAAISENPVWSDPYFELSAVYADMCVSTRDQSLQKQFAQKAIDWHEEGKRHPQPDDPRLMKNPLDYDYNPAAVVQVCYQILGNLEKAKSLLDEAIAIGPDPRLVEVRDMYHKVLSKRSAISSGLNLASHLFNAGEPLKAQEVLRALPAGSESETQTVGQARAALANELRFVESDNSYENHYFLDPETDEPNPDRPTDEEKWLLRRLKAAGAKRVLDVGVGNGQTALYLAKNGIQVVGLDIDPRRVKNANFAAVKHGFLQKKYSRTHGRQIPVLVKRNKPLDVPVQFWYGAIERVPTTVVARGPYDAVLLDGLLHRVRDVDSIIPAAEALAPRVLVTVPDATSLNYEAPKGTLRAFDQMDVEGLFVERGTFIESHHIGGLICLEYVKGTPPHRRAVPDPAVVIWCGPGWEAWTPDQINDKGLGGSETAVVHMAEEMVKRGLRVMVYAEATGTYGGVHYRRYEHWIPQAPVWMFVAWRNPTPIDMPIQADIKYLWMHDTDCGPALTKERADKFDSILVLSKWHRDHMRQKYALDVGRFTIIGNGIVPERFSNTDVSRTNTVIYSSSPDRGLEQVLNLWPEIRRRTGAELRILYGWDNYDLMGGPAELKNKILELSKADGVTWVGRVGQQELAEEMLKAKVLFYPGPHTFAETFCITTLEAQAAGCVPVTRDNGALPETNKYGLVLPNDSKPKRWFAAIQEALDTTDSDRTKMREWATTQTWAEVANRVIHRSIEIDSARQQQETQLA